MTERQILLVKRSWSYFRQMSPALTGDVFYSKLFLDVPEVRHLFHTSRDEQSKKLVDMLSHIVGHLDSFEAVRGDVQQLGIRHVGYGVKPHHYKAVKSALLWTLEQGLGQDWNQEVRQAWADCIENVAQTMIEASEEAAANGKIAAGRKSKT